MKEVFSTLDPLGREVKLYPEQWAQHIQKRHSEVEKELIKSTIEDPDKIYKSKSFDNRDVYFKKESLHRSTPYVLTVVEFNENTAENATSYVGKVITSYAVEKIKGVDESEVRYEKS